MKIKKQNKGKGQRLNEAEPSNDEIVEVIAPHILAQELTRSEVPEHALWLGVYIYAMLDALNGINKSRHSSLYPSYSSMEEARAWVEEYGDLVLQINMLDNQIFDMVGLIKRYGKDTGKKA